MPGNSRLPGSVSLNPIAAWRSLDASLVAADPTHCFSQCPVPQRLLPSAGEESPALSRPYGLYTYRSRCLSPHHHSDKYQILGSKFVPLFKKDWGLGLAWTESFASCLEKWEKWERGRAGEMWRDRYERHCLNLRGLRNPWKAIFSTRGRE